MHDVLLILGAALLTFALTRLATTGGANAHVIYEMSPATIRRLENLNMALPEILAAVSDLEAGVASVDTEVRSLLATVAGAAGGISAADADALQARLESLRTAVAAIPAIPS